MQNFTSCIRHPVLRDIYDHWLGMKGDRDMPLRAELDPTRIPRLLPHIALNEVEHEPLRFKVRLEGTAITTLRGRTGTGHYLDEPGFFQLAAQTVPRFTAMLTDRQPACGEQHFKPSDSRGGSLYWVALPLSKTGEAVDIILLGLVHALAAEAP
jgi:hypothetical protein